MPVKRILLLLVLVAGVAACSLAGAREDTAGEPGGPLAMSAQERTWLAAHRDLRLGLWLGPPPIMFRGDDGHLQGLVPDYVRLVFDKLGIEPRRLRASDLSVANDLARAREVDVVAALPTDRATAEGMRLSDPFVFLPVVVVTRPGFRFVGGLDDLAGDIVAVSRDCVPPERLKREHPDLRVQVVENAAAGLRAVASGRVSAYVGNQYTISYLAERVGTSGLRIAAVTEYSHSLAVGVRRDWPELLALVNRALASISPRERKGINDYWTVLHHGRWVELPRVWMLVGGVGLAAVLLAGVLLYRNVRLSREVRRSRRSEAALQRTHETTRRIIESAEVAIVGFDYEGRVRLLNRAGETLTGYGRDELLGRDWFELVVPRERYLFVWEEFNRLLREEPQPGTATFESPVVTRSGAVRYVQWHSSVVEPGLGDGDAVVIAFGTDITRRLAAEEELRLTQFAVDNAAVGILRVLPTGRIVYANGAAADMLGLTREDIDGRTLSALGPFPEMEPWDGFWERLARMQSLTLEAVAGTGHDTHLSVEMQLHHLSFKGTELAVCFIADIAERKRVEQLREDVERMMRHDLRSPVVAMQAMLLLLDRRGGLTDGQREMVELARDAGRRMLGIIDLSRAVFRMEEGVYETDPQPLDLMPLVSSVAEELAPLMRAMRVSLVVNVGGAPAGRRSAFEVRAEELPCYALLANLLKNAVEASPEGGTVTLDLTTGREHVLTVHNRGVVPEAVRDRFFEKYVTAGKKHGTGLGTYTARLMAFSQGGTIGFTTSESEGTLVTVTLPVRPAPDA